MPDCFAQLWVRAQLNIDPIQNDSRSQILATPAINGGARRGHFGGPVWATPPMLGGGDWKREDGDGNGFQNEMMLNEHRPSSSID
jgi:hypothetical protein